MKTLEELEHTVLRRLKEAGIEGVKSFPFDTEGFTLEAINKCVEEASLYEIVGGMFIWSTTKEGVTYWGDIREKI